MCSFLFANIIEAMDQHMSSTYTFYWSTSFLMWSPETMNNLYFFIFVAFHFKFSLDVWNTIIILRFILLGPGYFYHVKLGLGLWLYYTQLWIKTSQNKMYLVRSLVWNTDLFWPNRVFFGREKVKSLLKRQVNCIFYKTGLSLINLRGVYN